MSTMITFPATGTTPSPWFDLGRHDDDPDDPAAADGNADGDEGTDDTADEDDEAQDLLAEAADGDTDDDGDEDEPEGLGDAGKRALARMKAERAAAKKEAAAAKKAAADERRKAAALAKRVDEFEDRDRTDLEKAQKAAERATEQAAKATARAVRGEIKVGAAGRFTDPEDAIDVLMLHPDRYVGDDGDVDTDAIETALDELLQRKPHWGVREETAAAGDGDGGGAKPKAKPKPKPDPGQGSRGAPAAKDFRTASKDEVDTEMKRLGVRPL